MITSMVQVAVYDASVLYPSTTRDLLIRVAQAGLVQARWTETILDEVFRSIRADRPDLDPAKLLRTRALMGAALRDVLVVGHEPLVAAVELPDPDDRHVLAAAVRCGADAIVTANLRDFPERDLRRWGVTATSPDDFLLSLIEDDAEAVEGAVARISRAWTTSRGSPSDVLHRLERGGLVKTVAALRRL